LQVKSAIPHPRIMGIIRECGGKMNVENKDFESAFSDFFEAFKNYDEAGSQRRIQVSCGDSLSLPLSLFQCIYIYICIDEHLRLYGIYSVSNILCLQICFHYRKSILLTRQKPNHM